MVSSHQNKVAAIKTHVKYKVVVIKPEVRSQIRLLHNTGDRPSHTNKFKKLPNVQFFESKEKQIQDMPC